MHKHHLRNILIAAATAVALSACGGGGGDSGSTPVARTTDVPDSALASVDGLLAYMKTLIGMTSETSDPILVGDVVLPTDEKAEPGSVN